MRICSNKLKNHLYRSEVTCLFANQSLGNPYCEITIKLCPSLKYAPFLTFHRFPIKVRAFGWLFEFFITLSWYRSRCEVMKSNFAFACIDLEQCAIIVFTGVPQSWYFSCLCRLFIYIRYIYPLYMAVYWLGFLYLLWSCASTRLCEHIYVCVSGFLYLEYLSYISWNRIFSVIFGRGLISSLRLFRWENKCSR